MLLKNQESSQTKFLWTVAMLQIIIMAIFFLLVRYDESASPTSSKTEGEGEELLKFNLEAYPLGMDVFMMLFAGFGYLMTFLKRYGMSAIGFTMIITVVVTEFAIVVFGVVRLDNDFVIKIGFIEIVEGGVVASAVLISFGVLLGKVNPLQLLVMAVIECIFVVINCHIGYTIMGARDVGGSIFIHTFGAYFGLAVSFCLQKINTEHSSHIEAPRYTSDMFSLLGTIILWVFWPSFNGILAVGAARHRCFINTYISLMASTAWTFVLSGLLGNRRFCAEDIQNASLAGGVMVGATADMVLQPYGAIVAGNPRYIIVLMGSGNFFEVMIIVVVVVLWFCCVCVIKCFSHNAEGARCYDVLLLSLCLVVLMMSCCCYYVFLVLLFLVLFIMSC